MKVTSNDLFEEGSEDYGTEYKGTFTYDKINTQHPRARCALERWVLHRAQRSGFRLWAGARSVASGGPTNGDAAAGVRA